MPIAGIDVARQTMAVVIRSDEKHRKVEEFTNTPSGHQALLRRLSEAGVERVCLEATGSYHLDLALEAEGLALMVVNPKAAKRFAETLCTRTKTDAAVLAEFTQRMPFEPWQRPEHPALELRAYARRLSALTEARTQAENPLHALQQSTTTPVLILGTSSSPSARRTPALNACAQPPGLSSAILNAGQKSVRSGVEIVAARGIGDVLRLEGLKAGQVKTRSSGIWLGFRGRRRKYARARGFGRRKQVRESSRSRAGRDRSDRSAGIGGLQFEALDHERHQGLPAVEAQVPG